MRITFVSPVASLSGGIRVIAVHAERLRRRGHQVLVVSQPPRSPTARQRLKSLLAGRGWPRTPRGQPSHFHGLAVSHRVLERCRPVEDRDLPDADVVVATWWETAEWVARLAPSKGAKAYFIQGHEAAFGYVPGERAAATYALPMHKITISRWLVELMAARYGDPRVSLVMNSVDADQFHAPPRGRRPVPTVGALHSCVPLKGWRHVLEAVSRARQRFPDLHLVAFGHDQPNPEAPLPPDTEFLRDPPQERIRELYARCDVWLCGSVLEGFHLPPLEAMACRCPVVSTAVGGPLDRVEDGVNGYLVPIGDAAALADRLVRVLAMPEATWRAMSQAAHATATGYSWDDAAALLERALLLAIERSPHAA